MNPRDLARHVAPRWLLRAFRQWRARHLTREFGRLPLQAAFDRIYLEKQWGEGDEPSGSGSYGAWAREYVAFIGDLVAETGAKTAVDVGCGDFNVGSRLCGLFERYEALDVSRVIIERNAARFAHLRHVRFAVADATRDPLPRADIVMIRQVLQHLTNVQIEAILRNAETSGTQLVVVAEHGLPDTHVAAFNLDLEAHSPMTRLIQHSCVRIDKPPFNRPARLARAIPADRPVLGDVPEYLNIFVLEPAAA